MNLKVFVRVFLTLIATVVVAKAQFSYTVTNGSVTITGYTGTNTDLVIPSETNGLPIKSIAATAFENSSLASVTIPNSVTNIGSGAFEYCFNLTNVTLPDGIISIASETFSGCSNLAGITIPQSVTVIGDYAFANFHRDAQLRGGLANITIPDSVTTIGQYAFEANALKSITMPNALTNIGNCAFQSCIFLTNVTLPSTIKSIGSWFLACSSLANITIPTNITTIGESAFAGSGLTSVIIPDSVTIIGDSAFCDTRLTNVMISSGITNISMNAFCECYELQAFGVSPDNTAFSTLEGVLFNSNKTVLVEYPAGKTGESYIIPDSVITIGDGAFFACNLLSVTIPNSVISIGDSSFSKCNLLSVTIPDSVTNIGQFSFASCASLTGVTVGASVAMIGAGAFEYDNLTNIILPKSLLGIGASAFWGNANSMEIYAQGNAPLLSVYDYTPNATVYYLPGTTGWSSFFGLTGLQSVLLEAPSITSADSFFGVQGNSFGFDLSGTTNSLVVIEACTNLANPVWSPVATNTFVGGNAAFRDSQWTNFPNRFYRLRTP